MTPTWLRRTSLMLLAFVLGAVSLLAQGLAPAYDVVIRNGRVLDGMGNPWIAADVAIKDGRFVAHRHGGRPRRAGDRRDAAGTCRPAGST